MGQKVAFAGRTVKWASSGRGVVRGFPSLNWAQNQALCPRFKPVVRSVRRWAAAEAREFKQLGQLRSFQRGKGCPARTSLGPAAVLEPAPLSVFPLRRPRASVLTTRPLFPFACMLLQNLRLRVGLGQHRLSGKLRALLPCTSCSFARRFPPSLWSHWLPIQADVNLKRLCCAVSFNTVQTHPVPE